ncbi:MAG: hypothetical protein HRT69_03625 [Flavobacteriaceae bacterium]|nr:hypothetical protein [Flavobacteriaceae bacterium]
MKNKILIIVASLLLAVLLYGTYLYNKPHKNILDSDSDISYVANTLINKFNANKITSNDLLDKVIEISGNVTLVEESEKSIIVVLNNGVKCELKNTTKTMKIGDHITIKGVYSGFDEMFNEISLTRCHLIK